MGIKKFRLFSKKKPGADKKSNDTKAFLTFLNGHQNDYSQRKLPNSNEMFLDKIFNIFSNETANKEKYQKNLAIGIIVFLLLQLIFIGYVIIRLDFLIITSQNSTSEIFLSAINSYIDFLKIYIGGTLFEFVSIFCYLVKWAFGSSVSKLLNKAINNNDNSDNT